MSLWREPSPSILNALPAARFRFRSEPAQIMFFGNSIANYGLWDATFGAGAFNYLCETALALMFVGPTIQFKDAGTAIAGRTDRYGNYGFSGAGIQGMLSDCNGWIDQLKTANVRPDILFGVALTENDIGVGNTLQYCIGYIDSWIANMQGRFPGVILALSTPHQDSRVNTPAMRAVWRGVRNYMLSLDNNSDIFVANLSTGGYGTVADDTQPIPYYTFMATEGVDLVGVHPTIMGCQVNARIYGAMLNRIAGSTAGYNKGFYRGGNINLTGLDNITGGVYSGFVPTGATLNALPVDNSALVVSRNPTMNSWEIDYTWAKNSTYWTQYARIANYEASVGRLMLYCVIKIISGAEAIAGVGGLLTLAYTAGSPATQQYMSVRIANPNVSRFTIFGFDGVKLPGYKNGDVLHIFLPVISKNPGGTVSAATHDIALSVGGIELTKITYRVLSSGYVDLG